MPLLALLIPAAAGLAGKYLASKNQPGSAVPQFSPQARLITGIGTAIAVGIGGYLVYQIFINKNNRIKL